MTKYRFTHLCMLAIRQWPDPAPVRRTPGLLELRDSLLKGHPTLDNVIKDLNGQEINAPDDVAAKDLLRAITFKEISDAGYSIPNEAGKYLPVFDKNGKLIGHSTESYIYNMNGDPTVFSFKHVIDDQSYSYRAHASIVRAVWEADTYPQFPTQQAADGGQPLRAPVI